MVQMSAVPLPMRARIALLGPVGLISSVAHIRFAICQSCYATEHASGGLS